MIDVWRHEIWKAIGLLVAALLLGAAVGHMALFLLGATVIYLATHLYNLHRLEHWLRIRRRYHPPDAGGVWGDVFHELYRLQQRNRRRKRRLAQFLDRFEQVFGALPDATVVLGPDHTIQWANEAAARLLNLRWPQDSGRRIQNLVRIPLFLEYVERGEYTEPLEIPSPADGDVRLSLRLIPYGRNQLLLVARDMTRIHCLEQVRRDFVANVSHELRTPLTVMRGYLETIEGSGDEMPEAWCEPVAVMGQQVTRMQRIVEDLLLLARLEAEPVNVGARVVKVAPMLAQLREEARVLSGARAHRIELEADGELCLRGEEHVLRSAFANVLFNAVQYTPEGGTIRMRWYADVEGAHFEVEDNGIGVPPAHIPRLTERFYRVDKGRSRATGGTGLGLAIVKHALHRHDGCLRVRSEVGVGSTFSCDLPAARVVEGCGHIESLSPPA
ncbi:phosphate regulon sensor protein PhoR [bacterium BMS3Bbin12]|nr:phosphate regulon sensor protein PhoR [bacterium BMS3Abin12]GBE48251.1 phosphate regulon sensor protein PhoR [bacterium BMS3Bbin12]GBE50760.1 phosphate regulon sensor protein PhoR [bacterium BMS3Bbin13]